MRICIQKFRDLFHSCLVNASLFRNNVNSLCQIRFLLQHLGNIFLDQRRMNLPSREMSKSVLNHVSLFSPPSPGLLCTVQLHVIASTSARCWWSRGLPFSPQQLVTSKQQQTNVKKWRRATHSVLSSSMVGI